MNIKSNILEGLKDLREHYEHVFIVTLWQMDSKYKMKKIDLNVSQDRSEADEFIKKNNAIPLPFKIPRDRKPIYFELSSDDAEKYK